MSISFCSLFSSAIQSHHQLPRTRNREVYGEQTPIVLVQGDLVLIGVSDVAEKVLVYAIFVFGLEDLATSIRVIDSIIVVPSADCLKKLISTLLRARVFL